MEYGLLNNCSVFQWNKLKSVQMLMNHVLWNNCSVFKNNFINYNSWNNCSVFKGTISWNKLNSVQKNNFMEHGLWNKLDGVEMKHDSVTNLELNPYIFKTS